MIVMTARRFFALAPSSIHIPTEPKIILVPLQDYFQAWLHSIEDHTMHSLANDGSERNTSIAVCFGKVLFLGHWNNKCRFPMVREIPPSSASLLNLRPIRLRLTRFIRGYSMLSLPESVFSLD